MNIDKLIDKLTEIRKRRGSKIDVLLLDVESSQYLSVKSVNETVEIENWEYSYFPKEVKPYKTVVLS